MKAEWAKILSIEHLDSIKCWATLQDLRNVIYHCDKYKQIVLNVRNQIACLPAHDLSFATSFIIAVVFLMVKASRPMSYQYSTVSMVKAADGDGIIDQTMFKTQRKYGFDSLIFSVEVLKLMFIYT